MNGLKRLRANKDRKWQASLRAHLENDYSLSISFPHSPPDQSHQPKNCSLHCNCNHNLPLQFPHCPPSQNLQVCVVAIFSLPTLSASYKTWVLLTSPNDHINQSNKTKPNEPKTTRRKEKATKHNQILQTQQKTDTVIDYHFLLCRVDQWWKLPALCL